MFKEQKHSAIGGEIFVSCFMSFFWVSFYRYRYNIALFNSPGINWWAFFLWSTGLFITLRTYQWFKLVIKPFWLRILVLWNAYFGVLLLIEYLGYHIFKIREMTSGEPLCFGLIHGTPTLKIYYLTAGLFAIFFNSISQKALQAIFISARKQGPESLDPGY